MASDQRPWESLPIDPYVPTDETVELIARRMCSQAGDEVDKLDANGMPAWHRFKADACRHLEQRGPFSI